MIALLILALQLSNPTVILQWDPNTEHDLMGYNVYRSRSANGPWTKLTQTPILCSPEDDTCTTYTDESYLIGLRFHYAVTAVNYSEMESEFSEVVPAFVSNPNRPIPPRNPRVK